MKRSKRAAQSEIVPVIRDLVRTYQTFVDIDAKHLRQLGFTTAQFDVIATLGNTHGMGMRELSTKTLITKGTLTGVVDRLERDGLVERGEVQEDRRCYRVKLTAKGDAIFQDVFPKHVNYIATRLGELNAKERTTIRTALQRLRTALE
ncbi:MAG: MarR family transcriptional regulator [Myxococcota bacterium]